MFDSYPPRSVVVGIDGSQAAMHAALWALEEVAGTDIPLRLLCIREPHPLAGRPPAPTTVDTAEEALHDVYSAIQGRGKPVKVEMEIIEGQPLPALIEASRSTALLCIGGSQSSGPAPTVFGSTAAELVRSAHCSIAVVRGGSQDQADTPATAGRPIVARIDGSPGDSDVLQHAFEEAQRRDGPLWVVAAWQSGVADLRDDHVLAGHDRRTRVLLESEIARWSTRYPGVDVRTMVLYSMFLHYLTEHAKAIGLVVLGAAHAAELQQLVGPSGARALRSSDMSLLVIR